MVFSVNLLQNRVNVFHLIWIMSLHYLVKLEMLITQVLSLRCQQKKLPHLFHLNCGLQIRQIWIQMITACGEYCKRRCTKYAWLIWLNWNSDWEQSGPSWIMSSLRQPFASGVSDSSRSVCIFCNIIQRCYQLNSNLAHLEASRPQLRWNKFWSFFL